MGTSRWMFVGPITLVTRNLEDLGGSESEIRHMLLVGVFLLGGW